MSILVVDDNTMLLSKIVRSLVLAKQVVRTATSLAEARALLREHPPTVLCLDLQLPDGNGLDLLAELRQAGMELPVILISGHYSEENRARAERLGAAGFLAKPFALSELHRRLAALLGDRLMSAGDPATSRPQVGRPAALVEPVADGPTAPSQTRLLDPPRRAGSCDRPVDRPRRPSGRGSAAGADRQAHAAQASSNATTFMERGLPNALVAGYSLGLLAKTWGEDWTAALGGFEGRIRGREEEVDQGLGLA